MKNTETNTIEITEEMNKQLAFMQYEQEEYFIIHPLDNEEVEIYEGNEEEAREAFREDIEDTDEAETESNFSIYCQNNLEEVEEFDNDDYLILTDDEADEAAKEYIYQSLWAFNANFLACETNIDIEVFEAIIANNRCEDNNEAIESIINSTCGIDTFIESAISADGRGHFMSSYDGEENEETVNGETFYIYRIN